MEIKYTEQNMAIQTSIGAASRYKGDFCNM